ncbi:hypothetical protein, partial [Pseudomonas veronii]|uniref:hypothetical protein n=1 Tax=Pseudomonas veronii TaxID=76761 RepID=UPI0021BE302E
ESPFTVGFRAYVGFWFHCSPNPNYDDEVTLCVGLLRALVNADYAYCEALVKHADCSAERKADTLQFIADARDGHS